MKQKKHQFIFCIGLMALLVGCLNELPFLPQETTQPETGKVTLSIIGIGERTILPDTPVFTKYEFSFSQLEGQESHGDVQVDPDELNNTTVELQPGYWDITVKGFVSVTGFEDIGIPDGAYQAAEGKKENFKVESGGAHDISINLKAGVIPGEKGVMVWDITIPDDAVSAEMEILTMGGTNVETIDLENLPQDMIALDSGYYLIKLSLDGTPLKVEVLHIYGNLTSRIERTLYPSLFRTYRFDDIDALAEFLSMAPANTVDTPYDIVLSGFNVETDFNDGSDPMGKLFSALNGKYVNLDMSTCEGTNYPGMNSYTPDRDKICFMILPAGLTSIGENAFLNCNNLLLTSLPEELSSIGNNAFSNCTSLTQITLPATVSLGYSPFKNCNSLTSFIVTGTGSLSTTENGRVLVQNSTELVAYPSANGSVILAGFTSIGAYAFYNCLNITQITLPAGLISIGDYAFNNTQLTSVTFEGSNVSSIGTDAFPGDLDTVYADNGAGTYTRPDTNSTDWTYIGIMFSAADSTQLTDALAAIQDNTTSTRFTIICTEDFNIAPQNLSGADYENKTIALQGDIPTRKIGLSNQGSMFTIDADVELILEDITLEGRSDNNDSLVRINRGSLNMKDNASVFGNINTNSDGGGVYVFYGTFIMQGRASVKENTARNGGGVYSEGGTFTMLDNASVLENQASGYGGGVGVINGTFTMLGNASVLENHASTEGGGVGVLSGTFTMLDNTSVLENHTSTYGGGVFLTGGGGTFTMRGNASVTGNTAISSTDGSNYGGGVDVSGGTFNMYDSTSVSGNRTTGEGGGVFVIYGTFNMYNSASVFGNKAEDAAIDGNGGGVAVGPNGIFHIVGGIVYGTNESDEDLRNTVSGTNALGAALHIRGSCTAERGTFVDDVWVSKDDLLPAGTYYTDNTIKVADGEIVP